MYVTLTYLNREKFDLSSVRDTKSPNRCKWIYRFVSQNFSATTVVTASPNWHCECKEGKRLQLFIDSSKPFLKVGTNQPVGHLLQSLYKMHIIPEVFVKFY